MHKELNTDSYPSTEVTSTRNGSSSSQIISHSGIPSYTCSCHSPKSLRRSWYRHVTNCINESHTTFLCSSDADNEESIYSTTSVVSAIVKLNKKKINQKIKDIKLKAKDVENPAGVSTQVVKEVNKNVTQNQNYICEDNELDKGRINKLKSDEHKKDNTSVNNIRQKLKHNLSCINQEESEYEIKFPDPEFYKIEVEKSSDKHLPKRFVFDLVENHPTLQTKAVQYNFENEINKFDKKKDEDFKKPIYKQETVKNNQKNKSKKQINRPKCERIDLYYFDHGNCKYYYTTDAQPVIKTEEFVDKTEEKLLKFWGEIFGFFHMGFSLLTTFLLQLLRFILCAIIRPLTIGIIQIVSDYFIKPFLTILFNGLIQPFLILLYNIAKSIRDVCEPIAQCIGYFLREIARVFQAIRLVDVNTINKYARSPPSCVGGKV